LSNQGADVFDKLKYIQGHSETDYIAASNPTIKAFNRLYSEIYTEGTGFVVSMKLSVDELLS
jgi:hypothetical protein